jgi:arylsulfatase A-like enzyme
MRTWLADTLLAGILFSVCACGPTVQARSSTPVRNLLLLTVDTLRADHLGTYGAARPTPSIDALASQGVVFEQAWSASSWTLPSLSTLMTGRHARTHGAVDDTHGIAADLPTLAERARAAGMQTHGIGSHIFLSRRYGLQRGFESYDDELVLGYGKRRESHSQISSELLTDKAIAWLAARDGEQRWFLWVHYFDPHHVYQPHGELTNDATPQDLYAGEVQFTDRHIGRLLEHLDRSGLGADSLVVLVADHGEEFGEHGGVMHRRTLYEEVLRVPLIVRAPGNTPGRVSTPVSMIDLAPTCYELLDLGLGPGLGLAGRDLAGRSLARALRGQELTALPLVAELEGREPLDAVRAGRWKLIVDPVDFSHELFDLEADPSELHDLAPDQPKRCAALLRTLRETLAGAAGAGSNVPVSEADQANLEALGYGGGD